MSGFDKVVFVFGAGGAIGEAYLNAFAQNDRNLCYGFTRQDSHAPDTNNRKVRKLGVSPLNLFNFLSDPKTLDLDPRSNIREVVMVYAVGPSKFEPPEAVRENPERRGIAHTIDEDIYSLNLLGFRDASKIIFDFTKSKAINEAPIHVKLVAIASIADKYDPVFWQSYTKSKKILRRYIRSVVHNQRDDPDTNFTGIVVNVATIDTPQERQLRPGVSAGEQSRWLTPEQVAEKSLPVIESAVLRSYAEVEVYNPWPHFTPDIYKDNLPSRHRWLQQLDPHAKNAIS